MDRRIPGDPTDIAALGGAKQGADLLPSGDPELIKKLAKAMAEKAKEIDPVVQMRINIQDTNGNYIDNFVTNVAPIVGDFIDLDVHGEATSYEVIERRLTLQHFTDKVTNEPARVRNFLIIARPVTG